jgi:hypothetical protein
MPTPEEVQVNANIDLLLSLELVRLNGDAAAKQNLQDSIEKIRNEYQTAIEKGKTSKYYKDVGESIAKCLPSVVKGTLTAIDAFKKGDYISGSAALMDICASIIPVFASVLAAGGPAGALVGALFSVVGQILSYFAPKQPSLEDKIQKMLDHMQSESEIQSSGAFAHSVASYTTTLRRKSAGVHTMSKPTALAGTVALVAGSKAVTGTGTSFGHAGVGQWLTFDRDESGTAYQIAGIANDTSLTLSTAYTGAALTSSPAQLRSREVVLKGIADILAMPLEDEDDADNFIVAMQELKWGLETNQAKLDTPVFENWKVAAYLSRPENQRKEGWPEVLGVWCQTYVDLLTANMMLTCLADPKTVDALLIATQDANTKSRLPTEARHKCHNALLNLKALMSGLHDAWTSDNAETLKVVRSITPAAKERGLYAHVGTFASGYVLYVARGNGSASELGWDYKKNTAWLSSISIHLPRSERDSFTPTYELLAGGHPNKIDDANQVARHSLNSVTGSLSDGTTVIEARSSRGERFSDATGMAFNDGTIGFDQSTHPLTLVSIAIEDKDPACYLNYYTVDKDGKSTRVDTEPRLGGMKTVRSLYLPATTLSDDPDADALADPNASPPGPPLLAQNAHVVYGGVLDRNVVHVVAWNSWAAVDGPEHWDSYDGIEVDPYYLWVFGKGGIACASHASMLKCRQGKIARPRWIYHDFDKQFNAPEVATLSPCVDNTLLVSMLNDIYSADYVIDRGKNRIVTGSWVARGGVARQVVKMPIPCWPTLESLRAHLESTD